MKRLFIANAIALACFAHTSARAETPKLEGTYASSTIARTFTFRANGTAFESSATAQFPEFPYHLEGNVIKTDGRAYQFKILPDGSIDGGTAYGKMTKK